jgi:hypothetical protein
MFDATLRHGASESEERASLPEVEPTLLQVVHESEPGRTCRECQEPVRGKHQFCEHHRRLHRAESWLRMAYAALDPIQRTSPVGRTLRDLIRDVSGGEA